MDLPTPPIKKKNKLQIPILILSFLLGLLLCGLPVTYWFLILQPQPPHQLLLPIDSAPLEPQDPTEAALTSRSQEAMELQETFDTAKSLTDGQQYAEAIPYWNLVIEQQPDNGEAYKLRGYCYGGLSDQQRSLSEHQDYLQRALADVDQAIALGQTDGDTFLDRSIDYESLAAMETNRLDAQYYLNLSIENLRAAIARRNKDRFSPRLLPLYLFYTRQCQAGWEAMARVRAAEGLSAPPSANLLNIEAYGYLCEGKFEQALAASDATLSIQWVAERAWLRTIILYNQGRKQEALDQLNEVLDQKPYYSGYRYYFRALLEYEMGQKEAALADLDQGSGQTWEQNQERAYVLGRIALDEGRTQEGIARLQAAYMSLEPLFYQYSLLPEIERTLAAAGVKPPTPTLSIAVRATPMPIESATAGMLSPYMEQQNAYGNPIPPDDFPVLYEKGTGKWGFNNVYYQVFKFYKLSWATVKSVKHLSIHVQSVNPTEQPFLLFLWNPTTGKWTQFTPSGLETVIDSPEQYVDKEANVYLSIRVEDDQYNMIENIWVTLVFISSDGQEVVLDRQP